MDENFLAFLIMMLMLCCLIFTVATPCRAEIDMYALGMVESDNNPKATSFLGAKYGRGLYQVSEAMLTDYNKKHKTHIQPQDLYVPKICYKVAKWAIDYEIPRLLYHYGEEVTDEAILQAYNLGSFAYAFGKRNPRYLARYYNNKR